MYILPAMSDFVNSSFYNSKHRNKFFHKKNEYASKTTHETKWNEQKVTSV